MSEDGTSSSPIRVLGRYELIAPIARGGMGQVWAARLRGGRGFQKLVAIKTILPTAADLPSVERMMQEEARLAAQIQHPNVVHTIDLGEHEGTLYLVMEWVDGEPLHRVMRRACEREPMPLPIAVNLIAQACRGLHAAHEVRDENNVLIGLVHRDVSPQNILITHAGSAKLFDFGIAKAMNENRSITEVGEVKGKFSYMAPEQLLGRAVDRRADVFAMGIVLYWLTAGRHPFKDDNPGEVVLNITNSDPAPPPSRFVPGYPAKLEAVVLKALEKRVDARWSTAEELCVALQRALPEAFVIGIDHDIRQYLERIIGDYAIERREMLRRAQETIDQWRRRHGRRPHEGTPSTGSLKAIVVETTPVTAGAASKVGPKARRRAHTPLKAQRKPASKLSTAGIALGSAAVVVVALGAGFALREDGEERNAASPPAAGHELERPLPATTSSAPLQPTPSAVPASAASVPSAPNAAGAAAAPSVASVTSAPSAAPSGSLAPSVVRARTTPRPLARARPRTVEDGRDVGLLPPDYAGAAK